MKTRKELEFLIKDYAEISGIVSINPNVSTHLGRITMLDGSANLIEECGGDWCIQGSLQQLTDEEFDQIYSAVRNDAKQVHASAVTK